MILVNRQVMVPVASAVEETQLSGFVGAIYFIRNGVKGIVFNGIILKVLQVKFWVELTVLTRKNKIVGIVLMIKFDKTVEISSRISGFVGRTISRFSVWEIKVLTINMLVKSLKITCQ